MQDPAPKDRSPPDGGPDARQLHYWNSPATAPWVTLQDRLDALFAPLSDATLRRAAPAAGEHALDVGCGCGATVLELARRVGASGRVQGVDISAPMLARAAERIAAAGLSQATVTLADAATHAFAPQTFDLVLSRLGVMFFGDPLAAFAHLRRALKPTGRMVFLCCRTPAENTYITTAVRVALPLLPAGAMPVPGPEEPGMFSLADPVRVRRILEGAGFRDIVLHAHDQRMRLTGPGPNAAAEAAAFSLQFGPLTRVLGEAAPARQQAVLAAVTEAYRHIEGPDGIMIDGAFWIVSANP